MENPSLEKRFRRNWSDLCEDLLILIAGKLKLIEDIVAFNLVCVLWRSAASKEHNFLNGARQLPWLLLHFDGPRFITKKEIFAFGQGKVYETNAIPSDDYRTYSLGWKGWILVFMNDETMYLTNVFSSKTRIELPYEKIFVHRVLYHKFRAALSCDPFTNPYDYALVITCNRKTDPSCPNISMLMFWRRGDEAYSRIETKDTVYDAIFHHGLIYAFSDHEIRVFDVAGNYPTPTLTITLRIPYSIDITEYVTRYLLELGGDVVILIQSNRIIHGGDFVTKFKLFAVSSSCEGIEISDLKGNRSIFVGVNQSFVLDNASEIPECKPNHIYFIDYYRPGKRCHNRVATYNLANGTVEYSSEERYHCSLPMQWVNPTSYFPS